MTLHYGGSLHLIVASLGINKRSRIRGARFQRLDGPFPGACLNGLSIGDAEHVAALELGKQRHLLFSPRAQDGIAGNGRKTAGSHRDNPNRA